VGNRYSILKTRTFDLGSLRSTAPLGRISDLIEILDESRGATAPQYLSGSDRADTILFRNKFYLTRNYFDKPPTRHLSRCPTLLPIRLLYQDNNCDHLIMHLQKSRLFISPKNQLLRMIEPRKGRYGRIQSVYISRTKGRIYCDGVACSRYQAW
jgi:hypothetical protein